MNVEAINETSYKLSGDFFANPFSSALLASYNRAMALDHKLHPSVAAMPGMSGRKYRYLINNLVEAIKDPRYLEVGSWGGSTAIAAIYKNRLRVVCIDNWTEFGGPKDAFLNNINIVKTDEVDFTLIESDFRHVDYSAIGRFNIYLFDGPHEEWDHYDGVVAAQPALDDLFLLIVDDWNRPAVRSGSVRALADTQVSVICSIEIRTTQTDKDPQGEAFHKSEWHNGYYLAICRKKGEQE
jgi:hypothetical protein